MSFSSFAAFCVVKFCREVEELGQNLNPEMAEFPDLLYKTLLLGRQFAQNTHFLSNLQ